MGLRKGRHATERKLPLKSAASTVTPRTGTILLGLLMLYTALIAGSGCGSTSDTQEMSYHLAAEAHASPASRNPGSRPAEAGRLNQDGQDAPPASTTRSQQQLDYDRADSLLEVHYSGASHEGIIYQMSIRKGDTEAQYSAAKVRNDMIYTNPIRPDTFMVGFESAVMADLRTLKRHDWKPLELKTHTVANSGRTIPFMGMDARLQNAARPWARISTTENLLFMYDGCTSMLVGDPESGRRIHKLDLLSFPGTFRRPHLSVDGNMSVFSDTTTGVSYLACLRKSDDYFDKWLYFTYFTGGRDEESTFRACLRAVESAHAAKDRTRCDKYLREAWLCRTPAVDSLELTRLRDLSLMCGCREVADLVGCELLLSTLGKAGRSTDLPQELKEWSTPFLRGIPSIAFVEDKVLAWIGGVPGHADRTLLDPREGESAGILDLDSLPQDYNSALPNAVAKSANAIHYTGLVTTESDSSYCIRVESVDFCMGGMRSFAFRFPFDFQSDETNALGFARLTAVQSQDQESTVLELETPRIADSYRRVGIAGLNTADARVCFVDTTRCMPVFVGDELYAIRQNQDELNLESVSLKDGSLLSTAVIREDGQLDRILGSFLNGTIVYQVQDTLFCYDIHTRSSTRSVWSELSTADPVYTWNSNSQRLYANNDFIYCFDFREGAAIREALAWKIYLPDMAVFGSSNDEAYLPVMLENGRLVLIDRRTGIQSEPQFLPFPTMTSFVIKDGILHGIVEGHYFQWELDFYKFHMPWKPVLWSGGIVLLLGGVAGVFWNRHKNQRQQLAVQRAELDAELKAAATVQKALQPHTQGIGDNYWTLGETRAAWEVGGDFFAADPLDQERLLLLLGDVAGHGLQAGVLVATVRGVIAAWGRNPERTVEELLKTLHTLTRMNGTRPRPLLATAALLVDLRSGEMECFLNGIPRPWILASDGQTRELEGPCGLPLGARKEANLRPFKACIQPGDRILMLSDGILEQFDSQERRFEGVGLKDLLDAARALKSPALFTDANLIEAVKLANRTYLIPPQLESAVKQASMRDRESLGVLFQQVAVHAGITKQADDRTILLMELVKEPILSKLPKSFRIDLV